MPDDERLGDRLVRLLPNVLRLGDDERLPNEERPLERDPNDRLEEERPEDLDPKDDRPEDLDPNERPDERELKERPLLRLEEARLPPPPRNDDPERPPPPRLPPPRDCASSSSPGRVTAAMVRRTS